jgi:hypothetical protein
MAGSLMHVATGLFVTGSYGRVNDGQRQKLYELQTGFTGSVRTTDTHWAVKGGIEQKWTSLGATTLYGEYYNQDTGAATNAGDVRDISVLGGGKFQSSSKMTMWGLGINQSVEAAAMDLYVGYRKYGIDIETVTATGAAAGTVKPKDFQAVMTGAIIRF